MAKVKLHLLILAFITFHFVSTAEIRESSNDRPSRRRRDPVSNFFSDLGEMFLDIDGAIALRTAPNVEFEGSLASQILSPSRDYFDRVQENYKTLQSRLGSIIADAISQTQNRQGRKIDRNQLNNLDAVEDEIPKDEEDRLNSRQSIGRRTSILGTDDQMGLDLEKILSNTRKTGEFLSSLGRPLNEMSSVSVRRRGDIAQSTESDPQGRIIGDALYSESTFDQNLRRILRNHGRWVLDNPLLKRWRDSRRESNHESAETSVFPFSESTSEGIIASTEYSTAEEQQSTEPIQTTAESGNEILSESFEKRSQLRPFMETNYYSVDDNGRTVNEEVDIIFESDPEIANEMESEPEAGAVAGAVEEEAEAIEEEAEQEIEDNVEESEPRDTLILAFTPDGVPLKLRFGPEIENPVMYMHKVLRSAGVTLKVPVESFDKFEPVGQEVMLLGSGSGVITRSVYLDMSNPRDLKSFLRTLMRSKGSGRENY